MKTLSARSIETLRTLFLALPDLMAHVDRAFLIRYGTDSLTESDLLALSDIQRATDEVHAYLIGRATARYITAGNDEKTARRIAVAEFGKMYVDALDFVLKGVGHD